MGSAASSRAGGISSRFAERRLTSSSSSSSSSSAAADFSFFFFFFFLMGAGAGSGAGPRASAGMREGGAGGEGSDLGELGGAQKIASWSVV